MMASMHAPKRVVPSNGLPEPLENGERLTATEFLRCCGALPHVMKAGPVKCVCQRPMPDAKGLCRSVTFSGVILNVSALLAPDGVPAPTSLNSAVKQQAHRKFVSRPAAHAGSSTENVAV